MRRILFAACLLVLLRCSPASASVEGDPFAGADAFSAVSKLEVENDPLELSGYFECRNQLTLQDMEKPSSLRQRLRLEGKWKKEALTLFANMDADQELAALTWDGGGHRAYRLDLREAYAMYDSDRLDFFVGRKIHRWGTGDGINPMDLINPLDILDPISTGRADNRRPVLMAGGVLMIGNWNLEGVFLPRPGVCDLPRSGNPWEPRELKQIRRQAWQGNAALHKADKPEQWFADSEFGGRLSTTIRGWDVAALVFHGRVDSPVFVAERSGNRMEITPKYPEFTAYGLTFAKGVASSTFRGEVAWKPEYPYQDATSGLAVREDLVQAVLGGDYDLDGKYYFNLQGFVEVYGANTSQPDWQHGFTYEASVKWMDDKLSTGIRGRFHTDGGGALTEVFADYALTDNWKLLTGVMAWDGPQDETLGQYADNDYLYLTLRYSF